MQYVPKENQDKQKQEREASFEAEKGRKSKKKTKIIAISAIIALVLISWIVYAQLQPGRYDNFAKCLTEQGAVMYGEDWCQYTKGQKSMFGKSFKYINYEVKQGLNIRPTWVINGETYEKVQSFETLSGLTGCEI